MYLISWIFITNLWAKARNTLGQSIQTVALNGALGMHSLAPIT